MKPIAFLDNQRATSWLLLYFETFCRDFSAQNFPALMWTKSDQSNFPFRALEADTTTSSFRSTLALSTCESVFLCECVCVWRVLLLICLMCFSTCRSHHIKYLFHNEGLSTLFRIVHYLVLRPHAHTHTYSHSVRSLGYILYKWSPWSAICAARRRERESEQERGAFCRLPLNYDCSMQMKCAHKYRTESSTWRKEQKLVKQKRKPPLFYVRQMERNNLERNKLYFQGQNAPFLLIVIAKSCSNVKWRDWQSCCIFF